MTGIDFEARRKGIGGSDIGAILGLSRWATPLDIWRSKVLQSDIGSDEDQTDWQEWGHRLEVVMRQKVADVTGLPVRDAEALVGSEPWMLGNIDGRVGDSILELKTSRTSGAWGEPGTDEIPDVYIAQVNWYMMIANVTTCVVAVLIAGSDFRIYHVKASPALQAFMVDQARKFWEGHVIPEIPPPSSTLGDVNFRWPNSCNYTKPIEPVLGDVERLQVLTARRKVIDEQIAARKFYIRRYMEDAEGLTGDDGSVWLTAKSTKTGSRPVRTTGAWTKRNQDD